jgi:hypothetical protein
MGWQRDAVARAAVYLERLIAAGAEDTETEATLQGLRDVLDPRARAVRLERARELDALDAEGLGPAGLGDAFEERG